MEWNRLKRRHIRVSAFTNIQIELNVYIEGKYAVAMVDTYSIGQNAYSVVSFHAEYKSLEVAEDAYRKLDNILDTLVELKEAEVI
jgi:hypothetical protein